MSPSSAARGPAEELQRVLDGAAAPEEAARHARLVRTVGLLTDHRAVTPRAAFSDDLRVRLLAAAETELAPGGTATVRVLRPSVPARRRVGVVAASLVIVGTTAGAAAAASDALPGEPLYPVKRGTELVVASVLLDDAQKGRAVLDQAVTRLAEARELQDGGAEERLVTGALREFGVAATEGSERLFTAYGAERRPEDVAEVRAFAATRMAELDAMSADADPVVAASLVDAADTLADLDAQARELCSGCSATEELLAPTALAAGAGSATVDALLARPVSQARLDREALTALELDQLRDLRDRAQESAAQVQQAEALRRSVPPAEVDEHGPVSSTLTTGPAAPSSLLTEGPVRDLLSGVTGTLTGVTGTTLPPTGTRLDDASEGLEDTLSGVTGSLAP